MAKKEAPKRLVVGFTGNRGGMTSAQKAVFSKLMDSLRVAEFHHGDCVGSDSDAHDIATEKGLAVHIHPPIHGGLRAFRKGAKVYPPKDYLDRNRDIVNASEIVFATPKGSEEEQRSGTWSTVRFARGRGKIVIIIFPDGSVKTDNFEAYESLMLADNLRELKDLCW